MAAAAAMPVAGPSNPFEVGVSAESLWDLLEPRHVGLSWGDPVRNTEAVLIHESWEQAVFFLPAILAPPGAPTLSVAAQGEDGSDLPELLLGFFHAMPSGDYIMGPLPPDAVMFSADGGSPSLGGTVPYVPFELLPDDIVDTILNLPLADAEEPGELFEGALEESGPSLLLGPGHHRRLVVPPGGLAAGGGAPSPAALMGAATPVFDPAGETTPVPAPQTPPALAAGVRAATPPPAGRGRPLAGAAAGPPAGPAPGRGRGRGAGGARAAGGGPRLSLASLSAQLAEGFAAVRHQGDAFNARLTALEQGGGSAGGVPSALEARLRLLEARPSAPTPAPAPLTNMRAPNPQAASLVGPLPGATALPTVPVNGAPPGLTVPPLAAPRVGPAAPRLPLQPPLPGRHSGIELGAAVAPGALPGRAAGCSPQPGIGVAPVATGIGASQDLMMQAMAEQAKAMAAMAAMHGADPAGGILDESGTGSVTGMRGARGAAALLKWRQVFSERPQLISARVRQARNRTMSGLSAAPDLVPSMRNYFATEVPFGHAKTAAYLVFGLADTADLMEAGRWHEAEALVNLLLSAAEQAALQEWQWGMAWLLTFSAEPPWSKIRTPAPAASDLRSVGRLADPELLAAAVGHMKDFMAISEAQKKSAPSRAADADAEEGGAKGAGKNAAAKRAAAKAAAEAKKKAAAAAAAAAATG